MGLIGDLAMAGVVVVAGYFLWTNRDKILGSLGKGGALGLGAGPSPTEPASTTPLTDAKYSLSSACNEVSQGLGPSDVKCKCVKEGSLTTAICTFPGGENCMLDPAGSVAKDKNKMKKLKLDKCKINATKEQIEEKLAGAGYIIGLDYLEYAHGFSRTRLTRMYN